MTIFTVNWWSTQPKELLYILKNKLKLAIYEYVGKGGSNLHVHFAKYILKLFNEGSLLF